MYDVYSIKYSLGKQKKYLFIVLLNTLLSNCSDELEKSLILPSLNRILILSSLVEYRLLLTFSEKIKKSTSCECDFFVRYH